MPRIHRAARLLPVIAVLAVLAPLFRVEAQQTQVSVPSTSESDFRSRLEKETFLLVNQYRLDSDLTPLTWDDAIAREARAHSKDMATGRVDFGHEGFSDRISHLKAIMAGVWGAGENVLMTSDLDLEQVARNAVALWLHSPHHLKNILGDYNYSGLGVWQDKAGTTYFTQIFVQIKPPKEEAHAEPAPSVISPFGILATPGTRAAR